MRIWGACVLAVVLNAAMIGDMMLGKIKNGLILIGLVLGLAYQIQTLGLAGIGVFASGLLLTLAVTLPLFAFGAIGAGDGKLLAVVAGFIGGKAMPMCLFFTFLFGAVQGAVKLLLQGTLRKRLSHLIRYMKQSLQSGHWNPYGQSLQEEEAVVHLSAAILFGTLFCMLGGLL